MTQQQRINPLVEGAFLAAITATIGILAIFLLPVKFLFDFAWGIPAILIIKRHNLQVGLLTLCVAGLLTLLFAGPLMSALLFVELAPLALAYGVLFKTGSSPGRAVLIGIVVSAISTVALIFLLLYLDPVSVFPDEATLREQSEIVAGMYSKLGLMNIEDTNYFAQVSVNAVRIFIPSFFVFSAVIRAVVTYVIAGRVIRRLGYGVNPLPPFSRWKLPWYFTWVLILGLGLTLAGDQYKLETAAFVGKITVFSVLPLFFAIGLAVVTHFFKTWKIPAWLKVFLGIAAFINLSGSLVLFTLIGIFDPLIPFRNRKKPKE